MDLLARASDLDDQTQLVHNDFRAANILTRNSRTTGVLDFDDVAIDHRVSDLAKAKRLSGHPVHRLATDTDRGTAEPARRLRIRPSPQPIRDRMVRDPRTVARPDGDPG